MIKDLASLQSAVDLRIAKIDILFYKCTVLAVTIMSMGKLL